MFVCSQLLAATAETWLDISSSKHYWIENNHKSKIQCHHDFKSQYRQLAQSVTTVGLHSRMLEIGQTAPQLKVTLA